LGGEGVSALGRTVFNGVKLTDYAGICGFDASFGERLQYIEVDKLIFQSMRLHRVILRCSQVILLKMRVSP